jgi:NADH-quinone oxidoreductase subunit N
VVVKMFMQEPVRDVRPELTRGLNTEILIAGVATLLLGLLPTPIVLLVERSLVALGG